MISEEDWIPISALQHVAFCERQAALIHVERVWVENHLTLEGRHLHEGVDHPHQSTRKEAKVVRHLEVWSEEHGLRGFVDVVELLPDHAAKCGVSPFPVEYKRGRPKRGSHDEIQLCAQALCLEERFQAPVPRGALFYGSTRRRVDVECDLALRAATLGALEKFRHLRATGVTPVRERMPACKSCSLVDLCRPDEASSPGRASRYLTRLLRGLSE